MDLLQVLAVVGFSIGAGATMAMLSFIVRELVEARQAKDLRGQLRAKRAQLGKSLTMMAGRDPALPQGAESTGLEFLAKEEDPETIARVVEGLALRAQHRHREAISVLYEAFRRDLAPAGGAELHMIVGNSFLALSELGEAEGHYQQALQLSRSARLREYEAASLANLALIARRRAELSRSESLYARALEIYAEVGDERSAAEHRGNLGVVYRLLGQLDAAEECHRAALAAHRGFGNPRAEASQLLHLGIVSRERGDLERAETLLAEALRTDRQIGNRLGEAADLQNLGNVHLRSGDFDKAEECFRAALGIAREIETPMVEAEALGNLGILNAARGDLQSGQECHEHALFLHRKMGNRYREAEDLGNLGIVAANGGRRNDACRLLREAATIFDEIGAGGEGPDTVRAVLQQLGCDGTA